MEAESIILQDSHKLHSATDIHFLVYAVNMTLNSTEGDKEFFTNLSVTVTF